jgi:hypothetical protein
VVGNWAAEYHNIVFSYLITNIPLG